MGVLDGEEVLIGSDGVVELGDVVVESFVEIVGFEEVVLYVDDE